MQICEAKLKPIYLVALLQSLGLGGDKCIVFTSSVESTHRLCTLLNFFTDLPLKIKEYSGLQRQSIRRYTIFNNVGSDFIFKCSTLSFLTYSAQ